MRSDVSQGQMHVVLTQVIGHRELHGLWLNTLSLLENSGARKILAAQHPVLVEETMLRHSVEEARHAWLLKRQVGRVFPGGCPTYESRYLLAPAQSRRLLDRLDVALCRFLKTQLGLTGSALRSAAYLLVTYAIEEQAEVLYRKYDAALAYDRSPVSVRSILAEEQNHLEMMLAAIDKTFNDPEHCRRIALTLSDVLFGQWFEAVKADIALRNVDG